MGKKAEKESFVPEAPKDGNIMNHDFSKDWVIVVSRMSHPMSIAYMGEQIMVPPRGRTKPLKKQGLGAIPAGVMIVPCS